MIDVVAKRQAKPASGAVRLIWTPLLSIMAAALAVELPFFFLGIPSGHDVEFHLYSWLEVLSQWKTGIIYPRWAALAHFGYGEPRFIFYPPASWMLGTILTAIFPWKFVPGIFIWLVLVAAGVSMFLLARQWLDRRRHRGRCAGDGRRAVGPGPSCAGGGGGARRLRHRQGRWRRGRCGR